MQQQEPLLLLLLLLLSMQSSALRNHPEIKTRLAGRRRRLACPEGD